VELVQQPDPTALDNVNTPDELARAQDQLGQRSAAQ
jgi:CTP:molybdopterin cytidylyltransferase MocA